MNAKFGAEKCAPRVVPYTVEWAGVYKNRASRKAHPRFCIQRTNHWRRAMDETVINEILDDLFSSLEDLETQSGAVLMFLKDQGIATDEKLAPYLKQAGDASNVRWRATRVRIGFLLASALKQREEDAEKAADLHHENAEPAAHADPEQSAKQSPEKSAGDSQPQPQESGSRSSPRRNSLGFEGRHSRKASAGPRFARKLRFTICPHVVVAATPDD